VDARSAERRGQTLGKRTAAAALSAPDCCLASGRYDRGFSKRLKKLSLFHAGRVGRLAIASSAAT